jgi:8-oxo-dGTP pyrophosphatase MutT (NUDIX family)
VLDLDPNREAPKPRDAATLVVVRDAKPGAGGRGIEVFCVERQRVGFLGGAVVFPGGKLDPGDSDASWAERTTTPAVAGARFAPDDATLRGLAVAACREALEEAAILPTAGDSRPTPIELLEWRSRNARGETTLRALLHERGLRLDLAALHPLARWITPTAESRRFDARFFLYAGDAATGGAHDEHETTASFWATPTEVLRRFVAGELQLAPPTHRTLEVLSAARDAEDAVRIAAESCLDPICPRLVTHRDASGDSIALVLPGDPEHDVREPRSPGSSRYVLRGDRFLPGAPP